MDIVDSHHHFWNYDAAEYTWIDPSMGILMRDYTCESLRAAATGLRVTGAVSVQARTVTAETDYLLKEGAQCPLVSGVVGWAPLKDPAAGELLDRWRENPLFKGVREICQGADNAEFFDNAAFNRGIAELTIRGLPFDLLLYEGQLPAAIRFVDRHPEQAFIVDHIAKPAIRKDAFPVEWARQLAELARRPNVVACKFSGVVTEVRDPGWDAQLLRPYFAAAFDAFGAQRLMFGSDWPVCLLRTGYGEWVATAAELTASLGQDEATAFFSATARRVYRLSQ